MGGAARLYAQIPSTDGLGGCANEPLFELHGPGGQKWAVYEGGRLDGVPEGTSVVNRARALLSALRGLAREELLPAGSVTNLKTEASE